VKLKIWNQTRSTLLGADVDVADTSAKRRTGLLRLDHLAQGHGLLIVPCEAIHTFGMKFPIDVVFIDGKKNVVKLRPGMGRWRIAFSFWANSVLELAAGSIQAARTEVGDQLAFEKLEAG
jgi:hypothetical protein